MNPITSKKNKLGFVGDGYMGCPIAQRFSKSGFKAAAHDLDRMIKIKLTGLHIAIDWDRRLDGVFAGEGKRICLAVGSRSEG